MERDNIEAIFAYVRERQARKESLQTEYERLSAQKLAERIVSFMAKHNREISARELEDEIYSRIKKNKEEKKTQTLQKLRELEQSSFAMCRNFLKKRNSVWKCFLSEIPQIAKKMSQKNQSKIQIFKKISHLCKREVRRALSKTSKTNPILKGRRIQKELNMYTKKTQRIEKEVKRKAEKEALEKRKKEEEEEEALNQQKKLNFLINQTEIFTHFILKKTDFPATEESVQMKIASEKHREHIKSFDKGNGQTETQDDIDLSLLRCELKNYQKKGLEWLVGLYHQGINGILADEMGLGKTVQSLALLAYLAQVKGIWGPFLIVTPTSTLHNWEEEITRFFPDLRLLLYWGSVSERRQKRNMIMRTLKANRMNMRKAKVHIVITSYSIIVPDRMAFKHVRWQYMILDEAQAIKSSLSQRWKVLLEFKARNKLLLTGTPIQNTMQELWALLHFIMPTLFDSHEEFNDWFSKNIEHSAENKHEIDTYQLSRLHIILKPFMLRREKKDIENELTPKVKIDLFCSLSKKQRILYDQLKKRAPVEYIIDQTRTQNWKIDDALMNVVMQFRKVCNHPELLEKQETESLFVMRTLRHTCPARIFRTAANPVCAGLLPHKFVFADTDTQGLAATVCSAAQEPFIERKCTDFVFAFDGKNAFSLDSAQNSTDKFVFLPNVVGTAETRLDARAELQIQRDIPCRPRQVVVSSVEDIVKNCGKMRLLNDLLPQLRSEEHRVLIYFQMTKMMDIFEEYVQKTGFTYLRLDGSVKVPDRKRIVNKWQKDPSLFIFMLSTRAGGIGINLTAADTVIFYDNDWNPTADKQAMDRAHRLGQKRQVTVYRLITIDTIEERIMHRASQKDQIQKMVIETGNFTLDGKNKKQ